jgi:hypothetical protein
MDVGANGSRSNSVTALARVMLSSLIDDAALFPPARASMRDALANHERVAGGPHGWMLGRFLCPASRLDELVATGPAPTGGVGAILDGPLDLTLQSAAAHAEMLGIVLLEAQLPTDANADDVRAIVEAIDSAHLSKPVEVFLEVRADEPLAPALAAVAHSRANLSASTISLLGAKLRCGGLTADAYPPVERVAEFIQLARSERVPFKATAGLHHPFRSVDADTGALQHGFVNMLAACAMDAEHIQEIIAETDPAAFRTDRGALLWHDHRADSEALTAARDLFRAYGSCSFSEPVEDLQAFGFLPTATHA